MLIITYSYTEILIYPYSQSYTRILLHAYSCMHTLIRITHTLILTLAYSSQIITYIVPSTCQSKKRVNTMSNVVDYLKSRIFIQKNPARNKN